ncbi:LysM peptidoglycan-binding domain-containing protein [uncultured Porphyromonas sp.]|uniref:LysM peptidoglycan-binding domain-containing protein n=1 Tax=uncultured Porphyromonas sp. TaxID=159274 RepID=UPI00261835B9|nr:LysM peptidoglycan-binding domain-containing protein [uncultured Porphyromonas sp.]
MTLSHPYRRLLLLSMALLFIYVGGSAQGNRRIREHEVQREETVYSIARKYNVPIDKIYELNPWARQQIKVGDKLLIPSASAATPQTTTSQKGRKHKVESGETLYGISRNYGVDLVDLLRANPGVTSSNVQVGMELIIPTGKADSPVINEPAPAPQEPTTPSPVATSQTRILVLLPLKQDKHYVEFYEGFLLGMYQLKKAGISMQLTTLDVPSDAALNAYIEEGKLRGKDLVVGGVTEGQIRAIAAASGYSYYIIPFSKAGALETGDGRVVLANAHTSTILDRVIPAFLQRYRGKEVIFTHRLGDTEDGFVTQLRSALGRAGISSRSLELGRGAVSFGSNAVVVPISPDRNLAQATMAAIGSQTAGVSLFGYPQWQAYGTQFQQNLRRYNTTIYTSFFFDPTLPESKDFLSQFTGWFSHKVSNSYPKYSVLGYDLARYFIRAYSMYGQGFVNNMSSVPSDGLQLDFHLQRGEGNVYTNDRFFFVYYPSSGAILREAH